MAVEAYAPGGREYREPYYWRPEDDYSWFDALGDSWAEGVFSQTGHWMARKLASPSKPFDPIKDKQLLQDVVGELSYPELNMIFREEVKDLHEAIFMIDRERKAEERRERLARADPIQSMTAGLLADAPLILAELAVYRSSGTFLRYMGRKPTLPSMAARDVAAAGTVEYTAAGLVAGVSPSDSVEDAIINGTLGTLFSAALIGGIEGTRAAWGKYRSHQRLKESPTTPPSGPC